MNFFKNLHIITIYIIIYLRIAAEVFGRCLEEVDFKSASFSLFNKIRFYQIEKRFIV